MRTYKTMLMTSSIPNLHPDDVTVAAGAADDTVAAGAAADTVAAGAAADTVAAGAAADTVKAGAAHDKIDLKEPAKDTLLDPKKDDAPVKVEVPEAYEFKLPEGQEGDIDPALVAAATPIFKELGLSNEQGQKVVDLYAKDVLPGVAQQVQGETLRLLGMSDIGTWTDQVKADKEIGGDKLEESLAFAAQAREQFATPKLRELLHASRLGNHPEVIRLFAGIGRKIGDGKVIPPDNGTAAARSGAAAFYDPAFGPKG